MVVMKNTCKFISISFFCLIILLFAVNVAKADEDSKSVSSWDEAISMVKKTVAFLGTINPDGTPHYRATAVLLQIDGIFHIATAKHVVVELKNGYFTGRLIDNDLYVFFNQIDGRISKKHLHQIKQQLGIEWIFHKNLNVDLAILPFPIGQNDDLKVLPEQHFLSQEKLRELQDLFFISYQPGIPSSDKVRPVYRPATVSVLLPDKTFYMDGAAFPGNSGSPVFVRPEPIGFFGKNNPVYPAPNSGKFVGLVGEYLPYQDIAVSSQTGRPRIIFEEHTGLSRIWSTDLLEEILTSKECKEQIARLKEREKNGKR
jgi:hypothetical protein